MIIPQRQLIHQLLAQRYRQACVNLEYGRTEEIGEFETVLEVIVPIRPLNLTPHYFEQITDQARQIRFLELEHI